MYSLKRNGLVLTLAVAMVMGLCACGQNGSKAVSDASKESTSASQESDFSSEEDYDEYYGDDSDTVIPACYSTDFKEQVILDDDKYKVTVSREEPNADNYNLKFLFENKTDKTLTFQGHHVAVDGVMNSEELIQDVPAKSKGVQEFYLEDLEQYETSDILDIQIDFMIYYADEDADHSIYAERMHIYPSGEETPEPTYTRETEDTDQVILDDDVCTVTYTGIKTDSVGSDYLQFYIENKTEHNISCYSENLTANDYVMESADFCAVLTEDKRSFAKAYLFDFSLEDAGLTLDDVDNVVLPIVVEELKDEEYEQVDSKTVTIKF